MKILFVAPRFHTNQVPLVRSLLEAGHDVAYDVLFEGASEDRTLLAPHVVATSALSNWLLQRRAPQDVAKYHADRSSPGLLAYARRLRVLAPDAVVVRDPNRPFSWRASLAARMLGIRLVLYTQGPVHAPKERGRDALRSLMMRSLRATWISPVPGDRRFPQVHPDFHYVPFAADLDRPPKTSWFAGGAIHLLCIGKFVPRKNHLLMLDAFDALRTDHDVHLTLAGESTTPEHAEHLAAVRARIDELGLGDLVTVRVNVPFQASRSLYLEHDVFVLPSRREPASVSILEAMAHGLPVVCSTTSGTRGYVERCVSGHVFESDDRDDLVACLRLVVEDRDRIVDMGGHGRRLAETVHHPHRVRDALLDAIALRPTLDAGTREARTP